MKHQEELEQIRSQSPDGMLHPEAVVEFARDPQAALHGCFVWDNDAAAERYRLIQARQIIRLHVTVIKPDTPEVRTYVSLISDRHTSGGYRYTPEVLQAPDLRKEMLRTALKELSAFRAKYAVLKELSGIFQAIDQLQTAESDALRTLTNETALAA